MKRKIFSILFALVLALSFSLVTAVPVAANPSWGDTLTVDTTLDSDLNGLGTALIIGADGITLNLNGHTISGDSTGYGVDNTGGYDDVTVKDGTIDGFGQGIRAEGASGFTLEDLSFSGDTSGSHAHVIDIRGGEDVMIEDVTIVVGAGSPSHAEAIRLESIDGVQVTDVEVDGGWIGVNFALPDPLPNGVTPTNGEVKDSTFSNNAFMGVFIANSTDAEIVDNTVTNTGLFGIYAGWGTGVSGVTIKENEVSGSGVYGITLSGAVNSEVSGNTVTGSGVDGIALYALFGGTSDNEVEDNEVSNSGRYGISLRGGASDNAVKENVVSGSGTYDLHWDGSGSGNTWEDNVYVTSNLP
jgi:parallel beta-helix repeat protein